MIWLPLWSWTVPRLHLLCQWNRCLRDLCSKHFSFPDHVGRLASLVATGKAFNCHLLLTPEASYDISQRGTVQVVRQHWPLRILLFPPPLWWSQPLTVILWPEKSPDSLELCWSESTPRSSPNWVPENYSVHLCFKFSLPFGMGGAWPGQRMWSFSSC